jgi:hypothetical protein
MELSGRWFLDGVDLWIAYSIIIEQGSADFLKYPPKKTSVEHDWQDANGVDVDLSRVFFSKREGVLKVAIMCVNEDDFWLKHQNFLAHLAQPGLRRLELSSHGNRSYYVYYQETSSYDQVRALIGDPLSQYPIRHRYSMVFVEPEPKIDASNIFLAADDGALLIV